MKGWPIRFLAVGGALFVVAVVLGAFGRGLVGGAISSGAKLAGYNVRYDGLHLGGNHLVVDLPDVSSLHGEPVFTAQRVDITYSLRELFGGPHLYGISSVAIERPKLTIIHHRDGTYNINFPANDPNKPAKPFVFPQIRVLLRDGSVGIIDDTKIFRHSRRFALQNVSVDAAVDPKAKSSFDFTLTLVEEGGRFPIEGRGTFDPKRGYELARIRAKRIGLGPLLDYALNSPALHVAGGVLDDVDARVYGLPDRRGEMQRHVAATANLDHFQPYLNGIAKPLRDGRGALRVYDDGIAIPKVDGSIAGVPVRIAGSIYDLAHPALRLGITGAGDVRALLTLSNAAKTLHAAGLLRFKLFVEGPATQPLTLASFGAGRIVYNRIPLDDVRGLVALAGAATTIVRSHVNYDGIDVAARGRLLLAKHTNVKVLAQLAAPARRIPYASAVLGDMLLGGNAVIAGIDAKLRATGVVAGDTSSEHLAGTFNVDARGVGTIGPVALDAGSRGTLYARVALDRPGAAAGAAFVSARRFVFSTRGPQPVLPGLPLAALPAVDGTLDADVAAAFANGGKIYVAGGDAHLSDAHALGYPIDDATARARVTSGGGIAADARIRGDLTALARAAHSPLAVTGRADIPVSLVTSGAGATLAQVSGASFEHVTIAGVALEALDATIALRGRAIDVYAARARLGGNDVVASGSFGDGGTLDVSASGIALAALRSTGLPIEGGSLTAIAELRGTANAPHVSAGVAASDVPLPSERYEGIAVSGNTALEFAGDRLTLRDGLISAGTTIGSLDGNVTGLRADPRNARYAVDARVRQADIATLARIARAPLRYPEGSLDVDVRVRGRARAPHVSGDFAIPEGSINGLRFRDAAAQFDGSLAGLNARGGRVVFGSSRIGFAASASAQDQSFALHAPSVELSDLNDYFDRGDTLGGNGSIDVALHNAPNAVVSSGRVRLAHTRFRRFDVGDTRADWTTRGRTISSALSLGSVAGRVSASGTITQAATQPLRDALRRTHIALAANAQNVDLNVWLPAAGIVAPLVGFVNARATVNGYYPRAAVTAHADLQRGIVGRIPVRLGTLDVRATGGLATVTQAALSIDGMDATGSGSVGLTGRYPLDLSIAARTPDVGTLARTVTGKTFSVTGAVTTTLHVTGPARAPLASDVLDATGIAYDRLSIPRAHAQIAASAARVTLQRAEIDFAKGRLFAAGFAPLRPKYAGIGPATAPLALDFTADDVDVATFAALLPKGTQASGTLAGGVNVVGTLARPGLAGTLALRDGSFVGPQERSKLTHLVAQLTFDRRTATLHDAHAEVGGGTIAADGRVSVPDLRDPATTAALDFRATSTNAVFDIPQLYRGRVNGSVTLVRPSASSATLGGQLAFSSARIPTAALLSKSPTAQSSAAPLPVALDLGLDVGNDVRVQGGVVDIGARGALRVGGTLAEPSATGELTSTGGTISFYRTFRLQYPSTLTFDAGDGIIPNVDATATTVVDNPQTDVTLHVTGPTTSLNVALTSDPNYSREQILGLLVGAQALGAVSGLQTTAQSGSQQNPFQAAAEGQLGSLLTQNILEPFSSQLGGALGLSNLAINYNPGGSVNIGAQKRIFKNVNAVFAQSFNYPPRESIGIVASPSDATAIQLTFFSQPSSNRFDTLQSARALQSTNQSVTSTQPATGTSGFSVSLQRKFR